MSVNRYNSTTGELEKIAGGTLYADAPIGTISPFGGSVIPSGYLLCNGAEVLKTAYAELYAVIGDAFGTASDNTKFVLPDLREATTKGVGENPNGEAHVKTGGLSLGEFIDDRLQSHTHSIYNGFDGADPNSAERGDARHGYSAKSNNASGRTGDTTEVKAVGVNYIIKAKQVAVPTDIQSAIEEQNSYSTEETYTGKRWIDGKPIYRKVVEKNVNLSGNSWNSTGVDVSEIDTLCNCIMLNSKFAFGGFYTKKVSNQLDVYCVSDANWGVSTFILEYTKI